MKPLISNIHYLTPNFTQASFQRGASYYHTKKVVKVVEGSSTNQSLELVSSVLGSYRSTYQQFISVSFNNATDSVNVNGSCSCPVGYNCKHIAAVLIDYFAKIGTVSLKPQRSPDLLSQEIESWLDAVDNTVQRSDEVDYNLNTLVPDDRDRIIIYILDYQQISGDRFLNVEFRSSRLSKKGDAFIKGTFLNPANIYNGSDYYLADIDKEIASFFSKLPSWERLKLEGIKGGIIIDLLLQTGRCFWKVPGLIPLQKGANQLFSVDWVKQMPSDYMTRGFRGNKQEYYVLQALLPEGEVLKDVQPPMYVNAKESTIGFVENEHCPPKLLTLLLNVPPMSKRAADKVAAKLTDIIPPAIFQASSSQPIKELSPVAPNPVLTLNSNSADKQSPERISVAFQYAEHIIPALPVKDNQLIRLDNEQWGRLYRDLDKERDVAEMLINYGFTQLPATGKSTAAHFVPLHNKENLHILFTGKIWDDFLQVIPKLRQQGWVINIDESFSLQFYDSEYQAVIGDDMLDNSDDGSDGEGTINDWFSLKFDLDIDGKSYPLIPMLLPILQQNIESLPETIVVPFSQGKYARIASEKLEPFLKVLAELFNRSPVNADGDVNLSRFDISLINQIEEAGVAIKGGEELIKIARELKSFQGVESAPIPNNLNAQLRPYQQQGLSWLQFLRKYRLNGILADDMGLGKTIQTLAHLLLEKQQGRLTQPALIVAPTSLMGNWRNEAKLFTPELKVIILQGNQRASLFDLIEQSDIVLTTYPLLSRDGDILKKHRYHYLILDEAQAIKNHKTKAARAIRSFQSNHTLCLTGTPMENHLGELWSMFDFLMPSFLGSEKAFKTVYRNPIEKEQETHKKSELAKRIQPFLLRRTKDEVATELPPKTEIKKSVILGTKQAATYESIRITMDKRIRKAIASKGLAQSHITILDALLKLRQVCCDPTLLKLKSGYIGDSAKLELLMEMLTELLAEGRKILVFSQFTSMLDIIETRLSQQSVAYTKLTGQTKKRDAAIEKFTDGSVNLFLISLKAGGVGLNLTQADTVIIYDPWWNPAVEDQAVDRAHRIGQDKPVFIYKLVVENSVEERMLVMQQRKRDLVKGIYSESSDQGAALVDLESLEMLFQPISE